MPGELSSTMVRIGRRLFVYMMSPGFGMMWPICGRVCSIDMNSWRSSALKAQVSTTCVPWVLIILTCWPFVTRAALPRRAGIVWSDSLPVDDIGAHLVLLGVSSLVARELIMVNAQARKLARRTDAQSA